MHVYLGISTMLFRGCNFPCFLAHPVINYHHRLLSFQSLMSNSVQLNCKQDGGCEQYRNHPFHQSTMHIQRLLHLFLKIIVGGCVFPICLDSFLHSLCINYLNVKTPLRNKVLYFLASLELTTCQLYYEWFLKKC